MRGYTSFWHQDIIFSSSKSCKKSEENVHCYKQYKAIWACFHPWTNHTLTRTYNNKQCIYISLSFLFWFRKQTFFCSSFFLFITITFHNKLYMYTVAKMTESIAYKIVNLVETVPPSHAPWARFRHCSFSADLIFLVQSTKWFNFKQGNFY